jgi:hypothetical protein
MANLYLAFSLFFIAIRSLKIDNLCENIEAGSMGEADNETREFNEGLLKTRQEFEESQVVIKDDENALVKVVVIDSDHSLVVKRFPKNVASKHSGDFIANLYELSELGIVPTLQGCIRDDSYYYLMSEYVEGKDLWNFARGIRTIEANTLEDHLILWLPFFLFLEKMNENGIVHGSILPQHLLIGSDDKNSRNIKDFKILMMDFVNYVPIGEPLPSLTSFYQSPELLIKTPKSEFVDLYSLIVVIAACVETEDKLFSKKWPSGSSEEENIELLDPTVKGEGARLAMSLRLKDVFSSIGFGEYKFGQRPNEMNLTTLLVNIHRLRTEGLSFKLVMDKVREMLKKNHFDEGQLLSPLPKLVREESRASIESSQLSIKNRSKIDKEGPSTIKEELNYLGNPRFGNDDIGDFDPSEFRNSYNLSRAQSINDEDIRSMKSMNRSLSQKQNNEQHENKANYKRRIFDSELAMSAEPIDLSFEVAETADKSSESNPESRNEADVEISANDEPFKNYFLPSSNPLNNYYVNRFKEHLERNQEKLNEASRSNSVAPFVYRPFGVNPFVKFAERYSLGKPAMIRPVVRHKLLKNRLGDSPKQSNVIPQTSSPQPVTIHQKPVDPRAEDKKGWGFNPFGSIFNPFLI